VPLSISRLRWNAIFCRTPVRSTGLGASAAPVDTRRFLAAFVLGDPSPPGSGEAERLTGLTGPLGLFTPGIRFPYNSRLAFSPLSGGAPNPKLPRGIGTPPFDSNLAILERRLLAPPLVGDEGLDVGCESCWGAETLRCCRAAIRSFRFPTGCACTDLRTIPVKFDPKEKEERCTNIGWTLMGDEIWEIWCSCCRTLKVSDPKRHQRSYSQ
jgi:hypothetical protein